jgi:alkylation response protein AidB-like acyl-CoA dehydrogenase
MSRFNHVPGPRAADAARFRVMAMAADFAAVKYLCTNAPCSVTYRTPRVAGGFSMTDALPLERCFRDAHDGLFQRHKMIWH